MHCVLLPLCSSCGFVWSAVLHCTAPLQEPHCTRRKASARTRRWRPLRSWCALWTPSEKNKGGDDPTILPHLVDTEENPKTHANRCCPFFVAPGVARIGVFLLWLQVKQAYHQHWRHVDQSRVACADPCAHQRTLGATQCCHVGEETRSKVSSRPGYLHYEGLLDEVGERVDGQGNHQGGHCSVLAHGAHHHAGSEDHRRYT